MEYGWIFLRVTPYFDESKYKLMSKKYPAIFHVILSNKWFIIQQIQNIYQRRNFRKKIYKCLDNCVMCALKGGIWLDIFTCSQSYSRDIFYKLDNKFEYFVVFKVGCINYQCLCKNKFHWLFIHSVNVWFVTQKLRSIKGLWRYTIWHTCYQYLKISDIWHDWIAEILRHFYSSNTKV